MKNKALVQDPHLFHILNCWTGNFIRKTFMQIQNADQNIYYFTFNNFQRKN